MDSLLSCRFSDKCNVRYEFSSLQFDLPGTSAKKIIRWGLHHVTDGEIYCNPDDPSYGREENIHTTVLCGIHDQDPERVKNLVKDTPPFFIRLTTTSLFKSPRFDVLKIGVESPDLVRMHERLRAGVPSTCTFPDFVPHVTVAFLKPGCGNRYAGDDTFDGTLVRVDKLVFSAASGYTKALSLARSVQSLAG